MKKREIMAFFSAVIITLAGFGTAFANDSSTRQNELSNFTRIREYDGSFTDIGTHWAKEHISDAYEYGVLSGIGGGLFAPGERLTAAQAVTIAAKLHMAYKYSDLSKALPEGYGGDASGHWAAPYYAYALNEGLIDEDMDDSPDEPITRAQTIGVWSRILQEKDMERVNTVNSLPDVNSSTPFFKEITRFFEAGIVQGGEDNSFNPEGELSRAEASVVLTAMAEPDKRTTGRTYGKKAVKSFAGIGTSGFSDETASAASFTLPYGLTADKSGKIVVFDTYNNALRLINNGRLETMAGTWVSEDERGYSRGYYRDGMLSQALFNRPTDGVYNAAGDLFVCDSENHVIRVIKDGRSYTFAGTTAGHRDGAGGSARFNTPMAAAIDDDGNLYVADALNDCIRKIDENGKTETVAGMPGKNGYEDGNADSALFNNPSGIAVNGDGSVIYIADTGNHRIRKLENGRVTTLAGVATETDEDGEPAGGYRDGAANEAMFDLPKGLSLAQDVLFVADSGNNVIRAVNRGGYVFTAAGTGEPGDREGGMFTAEFNQPSGVLWHGGVLYIADTTNNMIKTLTIDITMFEEAGQ